MVEVEIVSGAAPSSAPLARSNRGNGMRTGCTGDSRSTALHTSPSGATPGGSWRSRSTALRGRTEHLARTTSCPDRVSQRAPRCGAPRSDHHDHVAGWTAPGRAVGRGEV